MANTQINITANGTKTLAAAGKYCDRNIDVNVNVPVPSGYIKPTGSKTITENGTHDVTQYASAVVNVAGKPTQFTNLYDGATIHFKKSVNGSASGITYIDDNYTNSILVPYHHKAGEPVVLRMRGIGTVRDRAGCGTLKEDGVTRVSHYQISNTTYFTQSYDEYGDVTITFKGSLVSAEWYYFVFGFQYIGVNSGVTEAKEGPIITINEPIGNGGYVG